MGSNAQAALQAAATLYAGRRPETAGPPVKLLALEFKEWLDDQDKQEDK